MEIYRKYITIAKQLLAKQLLAELTKQQKQTVDEYTKKRNNIQFGDMFRNERTYFNITSSKLSEIAIPEQINKIIDKQGYYCNDYRNGYIYKKNDKLKSKPVKLVKILRKGSENQQQFNQLKKLFDERLKSNRKQNIQCLICITHNPYDIAGMSTDRNWSSCMNLSDGAYRSTPLKQVQYGGMVAYLIKKQDKNIQQPIARIAIKRLIGQNGGYIFVSQNRIYGDEQFAKQINFDKEVIKILEQSNNNTAGDNQLFERHDDSSYSDSHISMRYHFKDLYQLIDYINQDINNLNPSLIKSLNDSQINAILYYCLDNLTSKNISKIYEYANPNCKLHLYSRQHFIKLLNKYQNLLKHFKFDEESINVIINTYISILKDNTPQALLDIYQCANHKQRIRILNHLINNLDDIQKIFAIYNFMTNQQKEYTELKAQQQNKNFNLIDAINNNKNILYKVIDSLNDSQINTILYECLDTIDKHDIYTLTQYTNSFKLKNTQHFIKLLTVCPLILQSANFNDKSKTIIINYYINKQHKPENAEQLSHIFIDCNNIQKQYILNYILNFKHPLLAIYHFTFNYQQKNYVKQYLKNNNKDQYDAFTFNDKNDQQKLQYINKIINDDNKECLFYIISKYKFKPQMHKIIMDYLTKM